MVLMKLTKDETAVLEQFVVNHVSEPRNGPNNALNFGFTVDQISKFISSSGASNICDKKVEEILEDLQGKKFLANKKDKWLLVRLFETQDVVKYNKGSVCKRKPRAKSDSLHEPSKEKLKIAHYVNDISLKTLLCQQLRSNQWREQVVGHRLKPLRGSDGLRLRCDVTRRMLDNNEADLAKVHVDHIFEIQMMAWVLQSEDYTWLHKKMISESYSKQPRQYKDVLIPIYNAVNSTTNYAILEKGINSAKGQGVGKCLRDISCLYDRGSEYTVDRDSISLFHDLDKAFRHQAGGDESLSMVWADSVTKRLNYDVRRKIVKEVRNAELPVGNIVHKDHANFYQTVADGIEMLLSNMNIE